MKELPEGFLSFVRQHEILRPLETTLHTEPEVSVRINPDKTNLPDSCDKVPWCIEGMYLQTRPQFTFDPKMHQGLYYVQDASSMVISAVIRSLGYDHPVHYLDACAAPGGKTTAALSALPRGSVVVANEYDYKRAGILVENVAKWGNPNVVVTRGDTKRMKVIKHSFDVVAVDAPCSGEGMMRKEAQAVEQWSPHLINQCKHTQREIINNVWDSLKPGGYLIYSTCTFNCQENEENLSWIKSELLAEPVEVAALEGISEVKHGIDTDIPCYRFIPGHIRGEGLTIAVFKKPGTSTVSSQRLKPQKMPVKTDSKWFKVPVEYMCLGDELYAMPSDNAAFMQHVASKLDTLSVGVHVGTIKGKDISLAHEFALSDIINAEAFVNCDLTYSQAMKYLQRDAINLPDGTPKGMVLLTYDNKPLGFAKNLGNRTNTTLPKQWRILSQNVPDTPPSIIS